VAVASVTAMLPTWQKLMPKWKSILSDYGLTYYHATEFNSGSGECAKLSQEDRVACVARLIKVASSFDLEYVAYVIERKLFDIEVLKYSLSIPLSVYDYLLICVINDLMIWGKAKNNPDRIIVSIENGCSLSADISRIIINGAIKGWLQPFANIHFGDRKYDYYQLADMIVYDSYKYFINNAISPDKPLRTSFQKIIKGNPFRPYLINKDWLNGQLIEINKFIEELERT